MTAADDRHAIHDVLVRYTTAIDTHDHDLLDQVFTPDATIDYRETKGPKGSYPEIRVFLASAMKRFRILQHLLGNERIVLEGDRATSRAYVRAVHGVKTPEGMRFFEMGGEYVDEWVRTDAGWRIRTRALRALWFQGDLSAGEA
ncbi:MAG: nuclear transport factor 2 family protein [Polyangiales bacterium]